MEIGKLVSGQWVPVFPYGRNPYPWHKDSREAKGD